MQEPKISVIECPRCKNYMSIPDYYCYKCRVQWYQDLKVYDANFVIAAIVVGCSNGFRLSLRYRVDK